MGVRSKDRDKNQDTAVFDAHRLELIRLGRAINAAAGIPEKADISLEELHAHQRARGVRPEDNVGSRDLMRMRYGDDWDQE